MKTELFTTLGCHLCDEALELLQSLQSSGLEMDIEAVEIADSEDLMDQYGVRIPVIRVDHRDDDLGWPFDRQQLQLFLEPGKNP